MPSNTCCPKALSSAEASFVLLGPLRFLGGKTGEREKWQRAGNDGKGEERYLPYFMRLAGLICGSVVMAEPEDEFDDFGCFFK